MVGLAVGVGVGVGLLLGLLGGGGSIVTVPALVYLLGLDVSSAAATSLLVVGANALTGAGAHYRAGHVRWKTAVVFGVAGLVGALPGAKLNHLLDGALVLLLFAVVMVAAALRIMRRSTAEGGTVAEDCPTRPFCLTAGLAGVGVGVLTGFFGVGGGFLVVPALAEVLGMAMPQAVGTSLAIIALNSASGLLGHALFGGLRLGFAIPLILGGVAGIVVGAKLSGLLPDKLLRQLFAMMLMGLALFLAVANLPIVWAMLFR